MNNKNIDREKLLHFLKINKNYFKKEFHIEEIGVFGSYARGEETEDSDIDIIVEFDNEIQNIYDVKIKLKEIFKDEFDKEVDIARKKYLKKRVKEQILKDAVYA